MWRNGQTQPDWAFRKLRSATATISMKNGSRLRSWPSIDTTDRHTALKNLPTFSNLSLFRLESSRCAVLANTGYEII